MKELRAVNGQDFSWDWEKIIPKDSGIDPIYIDTLIDQINNGLYQSLFPDIVKIIASPNYVLRNDLVFLDIGANLGLVSIYASPVCKRIVAIEPAPNAFPILKELTKPFPNIECINEALDYVNGSRTFYVNDINFTASSTVNTYGKPTVCDTKTLASILKDNNLTHVDACKIDVEGAEGEALDYYQINNAKDIIDTWYVEFHNCPKTSWEHKLGTAVGNFLRCGYHKMEINGMALIARK